MQNLKYFTLISCSDKDDKIELNNFLNSFTTLESLILKKYLPLISTVILHENMVYLYLHEAEQSGYKRYTLTTEEIELLDRECPKLNILELDIDLYKSWVSFLWML